MEFNHLLPLFTRAHYPMLTGQWPGSSGERLAISLVRVSGPRLDPYMVGFQSIMYSLFVHNVPIVPTAPSPLSEPLFTSQSTRLISIRKAGATRSTALI
jgi:hypothetical protein